MKKRETHMEQMGRLMAMFGETIDDFERHEREEEKRRADSGEWYEQGGVGLPHVI